MIRLSPGSNPADCLEWGRGRLADFFLRPPTLTASNFAALWPTTPKFSALKNLNPFSTVFKVQEAGSILKVGFALSKWPHVHRAYVIGGGIFFWLVVYFVFFLLIVLLLLPITRTQLCKARPFQKVNLSNHFSVMLIWCMKGNAITKILFNS